MQKVFSAIVALFFTATLIAQQSEKIAISVLPFFNLSGNHTSYANVVQELVTKEFVRGSRFTILDRSKFQKVLDELNIQKKEELLNSKIVEQGKIAGAQYLITGVLTDMNSTKEVKSYQDPQTGRYYNREVWNTDIKFSFQVINVETSSAVYSENLTASNGALYNTNEAAALDNAQCKINKAVKAAVRKMFPEELEILKVEKEKKDLPHLVLISAGSNYFDENYKKGDECEKSAVDKIFNVLNPFDKKESIHLKVYEVEVMTVNGKEVKREKELGRLKLKEVQGEVSVCEVNKGAKEIQEKLNASTRLLVKIL